MSSGWPMRPREAPVLARKADQETTRRRDRAKRPRRSFPLVPCLMSLVAVQFEVARSRSWAATTYYVAPTGNDSNSGSSGSPWQTIQHAANYSSLTAGDTVTVQAGTYNERVSVTRSGSSGNLITFQAQGTVVTQGFNIQANYVKVDGFEMAN